MEEHNSEHKTKLDISILLLKAKNADYKKIFSDLRKDFIYAFL